MTSTLLSSKTYSPVSGSLFDSFKLFSLPCDVMKTIDDMAEMFGKKVPNHMELSDYIRDVVVSNFIDTLNANDMSILVFETTKITEDVNGRPKTRFVISDVPQSMGKGTKCASLMAFHNKNGYVHYEVLTVAPYLKSSFEVTDSQDANNSVRILSIPSNYFEQLRAAKFPVVLRQTESTGVSRASNTKPTVPPSRPTVVIAKVASSTKNAFTCLDNDEGSDTNVRPSFAQMVSKGSVEPIQKACASNVITSGETASNTVDDFGPYFKQAKSKQRKYKKVADA